MVSLLEKIDPEEEKAIIRRALILALALLLITVLPEMIRKRVKPSICCHKCIIEISIAQPRDFLYHEICLTGYKKNDREKLFTIDQLGWRVQVSPTKEVFFLCLKKYSLLPKGSRLKGSITERLKHSKLCYVHEGHARLENK